MAEQCANCGRSDLLQPDIANLQCLACGALTSIATNQVVVPHPPAENLSNAGFPVVELSTGIVQADANEYHPPVPLETPAQEAAEAPESAPEASETPAPEPVVEPEAIDLSALTPEQVAAVEAIVHQGG